VRLLIASLQQRHMEGGLDGVRKEALSNDVWHTHIQIDLLLIIQIGEHAFGNHVTLACVGTMVIPNLAAQIPICKLRSYAVRRICPST